MIHRYGSLDWILDTMEPAEVLDLIKEAGTKERDERLFRQWLVQLPLMGIAGKYTSFKDYKDTQTGADIDTRPTAEILAELDGVEERLRKEA